MLQSIFESTDNMPEYQKFLRDPEGLRPCSTSVSTSTGNTCLLSDLQRAQVDSVSQMEIESPLVATTPYEKIDVYLSSRHSKPKLKSQGQILKSLPVDVLVIYLVLAFPFGILFLFDGWEMKPK